MMKKIILIILILFTIYTSYVFIYDKNTSFDETETIPEFYKNTGCLFISLFKVMDQYGENIDLNDIEKAYKKIFNKEYIFSGNYNDLEKVVNVLDIKKKYKFFCLPSNKELADEYIDNNIPIFFNIPKMFPAFYSHSVLLMKKDDALVIFDPVEYLKDKNSEKHTKPVSKEKYQELLKNRSFFVLLDIESKIPKEAIEITKLVNQISVFDFNGLENEQINNSELSVEFKEKVLFEMNKNNQEKIKKLYDEYREKYKDIKLKTDYDYLKYFVENNILDEKYFFSIADKIYNDLLSVSIYYFPVMKKLYFYTAAGCSISNNKEKLAEYENAHFSGIKLVAEVTKHKGEIPFFGEVKKIGLTAETFKVYKNLDEIPDILNLKK